MKIAEADALADGIVRNVKDYVARAKAPLTASIADLEERLAAMEKRLAAIEGQARSGYKGVWSAGEEYVAGDQCTHSGGLWIATSAGRGSKPGTGTGWKLAVKKGRAA